MINDKEFLKFEEGFFKPYFEKFIEFKRGKGEKVASSTLIRFRKLNNSLNQYQTMQIAIFRGQQGRISRPDRAILNGQF